MVTKMIYKRFRIVQASEADDAIDSTTSSWGIGAKEFIERMKRAVAAFLGTDQELYQERLNDTINRLQTIDKAAGELAVRLRTDKASAVAILSAGNFANFDQEDTANALIKAFEQVQTYGLTGDEPLRYLSLCLEKSPQNYSIALEQYKRDMTTMKNIADSAKLPTVEIFEIFYSALTTGNNSQINSLLTVLPLLRVKWGKFETTDMSEVTKSLNDVQNVFKTQLDPTAEGALVQKLFESINQVKLAFKPIQVNLDKFNIDQAIAINDHFKDIYLSEPAKQIEILKAEQKTGAQNKVLRDARPREQKTNTAPSTVSTPVVEPVQKRTTGSSKIFKKIRIVMAADLTDTPVFRAFSSKLVQINETNLQLQNDIELQSISVNKLEEFFNGQYVPVGSSDTQPYVQAIISVLDANTAISEIDKLRSSISSIKIRIADQKAKIINLLNDPSIPAAIKPMVQTALSNVSLYNKTLQEQETRLNKYEKLKLFAKDIKEIDDKIRRYNKRKKQVTPKTTEVFIYIKDRKTGKITGVQNRLVYISDTHDFGIEIGAKIRKLSNDFKSRSIRPGDDFDRNSERLLDGAEDFEADNDKWLAENLPKPQMVE
jgi:uncharacterized protein YwbE